MVDWADRALEREERHRELALQAQLAQATPSGPSLTHCTDCDCEIPAKRRALGGISRCVPCQTTLEQGQRR